LRRRGACYPEKKARREGKLVILTFLISSLGGGSRICVILAASSSGGMGRGFCVVLNPDRKAGTSGRQELGI
jgi:hypothetical protein